MEHKMESFAKLNLKIPFQTAAQNGGSRIPQRRPTSAAASTGTGRKVEMLLKDDFSKSFYVVQLAGLIRLKSTFLPLPRLGSVLHHRRLHHQELLLDFSLLHQRQGDRHPDQG